MKSLEQKPKIIVVLGPTATGKSDLAVELAREFNGEIISADSRQVYKGLDIGSGKITKKEMRGVPHYLLDVVTARTVFSVADFQKHTDRIISDILKREKVPIIAGGTAFYIQSIVDGFILPEIPQDKTLRKKLESTTIEKLQSKLQKMDPERFKEIDQNNPVRLIRAIEIATHLKKVPKLKSNPKYECLQIGLNWPTEILHKRIHDRLLARMKIGMVAEVQKLHKSGITWKRMEELGLEYRYLTRFVRKQISREQMLLELETKIKQFAKRQMTWFKRDSRIKWFKPTEYSKIKKEVQNFLK
jgi:tRNA dimethylallyltransferase